MEHVKSFNIFGTEVAPIPCTMLDAAPTTGTFGVVGMLAIDTSSDEKELYKCIAVDTSVTPNKYIWNRVGSSSTEIVDVLPDAKDANPNVDYILNDNGVYLYYKYVDVSTEGSPVYEWKLIAGSVAKVADTLPDTGNTYTDYYVPSDANTSSYFHYRWKEAEGTQGNEDYKPAQFVMIGTDAYSREAIDEKIETIQKDYTNKINPLVNDIGQRTTDNKQSIFKRIEDIEATTSTLIGGNELKVTYDKDVSTLFLHYSDSDEEVDENKILSQTTIEGGGGAATGSVKLHFSIAGDKEKTILKEDKAEIKYIAYIYTTEEEGIKVPVAGKINLAIYNDVNSNIPNKQVVIDSSVKEQELDLTNFLSSSSSRTSFKIIAKYTEMLDSGEPLTQQVRRYCDFVQVELSLTPKDIDFDQTVKTSSPVTYWYNLKGTNLNKTVHYKLDNNEGVDLKEEEGKITNGENFIDLPITTHGNHKFEIWCTADIDGKIIPTKHYHYDIMFAEQGNNEPIIRALLNKITEEDEVYEQYYTIPFFYSVYVPYQNPAQKVIVSKDGKTSTKENVERKEIEDSFTPETPGEKQISISCEWEDQGILKTKTVILSLTVVPSAFEVPPVVPTGLAFDFIPDGRTNSDIDYDVLYDVDGVTPIQNGWTFSENFDWINGGWNYNSEEGDAFCVKAGTWVEFNYKLFDDPYMLIGEEGTRGNGAEFKIKFKTTNVADITTKWLDCVADSKFETPTGLEMRVHEAEFKSNNNNLVIPYSEEDVIEFDVNIVPITLTKDKTTIDETTSTIAMVMAYEDGTPIKPTVIENIKTDFQQKTPKGIKIGGEDCKCDVYIYRMRAYSNFLTDKEIIRNFIADANGIEKNERFIRNQIFEEEELTPESVAEACPHLRVIKVSAPRFTYDKNNKVFDTEIEMIYKNGDGTKNWKAKNCLHSGQGTSSNAYGFAGRNLDLIIDKKTIDKTAKKLEMTSWKIPEIEFQDGTKLVGEDIKFQLGDNSVPINYLNVKVNIASSEHANNALLANRYDRYLPYESLAEKRYEGTTYDPKNTMEFYNCVVFIQETDPDISTHNEFADTKWHFYSLGNVGDSKKTDKTRVVDPDDTNEFCNEILDWNLPLANFPLDTFVDVTYKTGVDENGDDIKPFLAVAQKLFENKDTKSEVFEKTKEGEYYPTDDDVFDISKTTYYIDALKYDDYGGDFTYEFRYLKDDAYINNAKAVWTNFYKFVIQDIWKRDKKGNIIQTEQPDGSYINTIDKDKLNVWKSGLKEWFIEKSALYYYVFTLRYSMVDNRAKNSFWHYAKTGTIRTVSNPVAEMLHVYYEKVDKDTSGAELFKDLNMQEGYYKKAEEFIEGKTYYTQYAFEFWDYDNDTALGIDNTGKLELEYGIEENDGGKYFRAHDSTFFVNLSNCFPSELTTTYNNVDINCFSAKHLIEEFDEWQKEFPEELWRIDYETKYKRTYVAGYGEEWDNRIDPSIPVNNKHGVDKDFLKNKMNGRKRYQRRQFERDQERYMRGRFDDNTLTGNAFDLRTADIDVPMPPRTNVINVTAHSKSWINFYNNATNRFDRRRFMPNQTLEIKYPTDNIDFFYIHNADCISDLGDLSSLYLEEIKLGSGIKLRKAVIGNDDPTYANPQLADFTIDKSSGILEEINVQNVEGVKSLPLNVLPSLKYLYAYGSGLTDATFANNGLVTIAQLPTSVQSITAKNLYYLRELDCKGKDASLPSDYSGIYELTIDNCPNLSQSYILNIITQALQGKLNTLYLTGINWTGENALADTSLLNKLASLNNKPTLRGKIEIKGKYRQSELDTYQSIWPIVYTEEEANEDNLYLIIKEQEKIGQLTVIYQNEAGEEVARTLVDAEITTKIPDPYFLYLQNPDMPPIEIDVNKLSKESDDKYNYHFGNSDDNGMYIEGEYIEYSGWSDNIKNPIYSSHGGTTRIITPVYSTSYRNFTVKWYWDEGGDCKWTASVPYGAEAIYGVDPTDKTKTKTLGVPTKDASGGVYKIFTGWDKSTGSVTKNLDVYAQWDEADITDYLDQSGFPMKELKLKLQDLRPVEIKAIAEEGYFFDFFAVKDYVDVTLGHSNEFNFDGDNIPQDVLISKETIFNGKDTAFSVDYLEGCSLFGENASDFTIAIDYKFINSATGSSLFSCYEPNGRQGFSLQAASNFYWGDTSIKFGGNKQRNMLVLRHKKNEKCLYIYHTNALGTGYSQNIIVADRTSTRNIQTEQKIFFGALPDNIGSADEFVQDTYASGIVYWSKIWYADLGDDVAKQLANWPNEVLRMECSVPHKKTLKDNTSQSPNVSFLSNNVLGIYAYSSEPAGFVTKNSSSTTYWQDSDMLAFLNSKLLTAFPIQWRSLLKEVNFPSMSSNLENGATPDIVSGYIYLPSIAEMHNVFHQNPNRPRFLKEGNVGWEVKNELQRCKYLDFFNMAEEKDCYNNTNDPRDEGYIVSPGQIWKKCIFVTTEQINNYGLVVRDQREGSTDENGQKSGGWLLTPSHILTRTYAGYQGTNMATFYNGYAISSVAQNGSHCFSPGFSI